MAKKKGGVVKVIVGIIVVILIVVIVFGAVVKFDVAGLGTNVFAPILKNIPIVNMILPEIEAVEEGEEVEYNFETVEEAVEILKLTEKMLKEKDEEAEKVSEELTQLTAEVERLKIFESNQVQFGLDKVAFDEQIVESSEAIIYNEWFEKMNPENAAEIYAETIKEVAYGKELEGMINIYQDMKPAQAASVLEGMSVTRLDQVATIIKGVSASQAGKILGLMEPDVAAKITSYIYPVEGR